MSEFIGHTLFLQRCVNQGSSEANRSCAHSFLYENTLELVVSASRPAERLIFNRQYHGNRTLSISSFS